MCGICGIFDPVNGPVDLGLLERMTLAMSHRGPDGQGLFRQGPVGLGHRRLSIIDVEGGAQPISNEDGAIQVVFNGEIYNYIELRKQLETAGHCFKTRSDTEVIVHGYEHWGEDCVQRFNGIFAFALWDGRSGRLFLARDHLGIKPLYYVAVGDQTLFASEIKALLQHPNCPRAIDLDALAELFTFRYVPSPKTLFHGILKLPPAHTMMLAPGRRDIKRFWNWIPRLRQDVSEAALIEEYQHLLEDAVRLQLRSDVPLGLFLSSGIDSGALLAIMSQHASAPVQTFTIGFEGGEATNEVTDARAMAKHFGAEHSFQMLSANDYLKYYERYLSDLEEPVGNETAAAFHFVAKIARQSVKVVLTGQGADEPWAGYHRYVGIKLSTAYGRLPRFLTNGLAPLLMRLPGRMERLKRGVASLSEPDLLTRFTKVYSFFSAEMKSQLYTGSLKERFLEAPYAPKACLRRLQSEVQHLDPLTQMLYIDTRANLPDDLLMVADKTSMANSLEARVPFLDYRLVEFIESLPPQFKLRFLTGKYLHKKALTKWLPRSVVYRKKKGFANPIEHWVRTSMQPFIQECLLGPDSSMRHYFNTDYIRRIVSEDCAGHEQYRRHIYLLLSVELWHRAFLKR